MPLLESKRCATNTRLLYLCFFTVVRIIPTNDNSEVENISTSIFYVSKCLAKMGESAPEYKKNNTFRLIKAGRNFEGENRSLPSPRQ